MLHYPDIDPIAFSLGPVKIYWYGLMYLVGFAGAWWLGNVRAERPGSGWSRQQVGDLIFWGMVGVVLGGRLGYVLFYDLAGYLAEPLSIVKIWQGGMSFHGGLVGVLIAMGIYARRVNKKFFEITDFVAPLVPLGLGAGRIGNFINAELWGRVSNVPWAMVFPGAGPAPRHPSQIYEAFFEGLVLFVILWFFSNRPRPRMAVSGMFLACYGIFRFGVEFTRQPDEHIGFIAFGWLTMGQILSMPLIIAGGALVWLAYRRNGTRYNINDARKA